MLSPTLKALATLTDLAPTQQRGVIDALAKLEPQLLVEMTKRCDLNDDMMSALVRAAPSYHLDGLLARLTPNEILRNAAVEAHGAAPATVVWLARHGHLDQAVDLAARVQPEKAEFVAERWEHAVGEQLPDQIRAALVDASLTRTGPPPKLSEMSDWEQDEALRQREAENDARRGRTWRLLEPSPAMWIQLACEGKHAAQVRSILLEYAQTLADEVLLACAPEVTGERLRMGDDELLAASFAGVRLERTADHVRRWPRLRELIPDQLDRVVREAIEDGWTPTGEKYSGPSWSEIKGLAELTDDPTLLADAATALGTGSPPTYRRPRSKTDPAEQWYSDRSEAAGALAANPCTPPGSLLAAIAALDSLALEKIIQQGDEHLANACRERLADLERARTASDPDIVVVPSDSELAHLSDPVGELRRHLRYLRGRAAQREATSEGILRSRYTTPELLRDLPAYLVLSSHDQATTVATMIAETCSDEPDRWARLTAIFESKPGKGPSFGAWLDRLTAAQ